MFTASFRFAAAEHSGRADLGRVVKPTAERRQRRRMHGPRARQVHTMHADFERQKRRDRSGPVDK